MKLIKAYGFLLVLFTIINSPTQNGQRAFKRSSLHWPLPSNNASAVQSTATFSLDNFIYANVDSKIFELHVFLFIGKNIDLVKCEFRCSPSRNNLLLDSACVQCREALIKNINFNFSSLLLLSQYSSAKCSSAR